jgi:hypothetical protein
MFPILANALQPVEVPLPEESPAAEDLAPFANPVDEMAPTPVVAENIPKGVSFNWAVLRAETQEEYDAKPPEIQHLIHEIQQLGTLPSQEWAANRVIEIQKEIAARNSPQAQADLAAKQADLAAKQAQLTEADKAAKEDAQKTYQRASNMVWLMDNLRGGKPTEIAENNEKWRTRVGSVDGRWPSILSSDETLGWNADFASLKGMISLAEAQNNRGQGALSDGERALMAQAAALGLEKARDEKGFQTAFERMYGMAVEAQQANMKKLSGADNIDDSASLPPNSAPPPPQFRSKEEVVQAVNAGQITREQGVSILRSQFNNDFRTGQ